MSIKRNRIVVNLLFCIAIYLLYTFTCPSNHVEAEDAYDFALKVEQGGFTEQVAVNRVLALPIFGVAFKAARTLGYSGRAFPFMIFINRLLAVGCLFLFCRILERIAISRSANLKAHNASSRRTTFIHQLVPTLGVAFSYGFWRYANEAETYMLVVFLTLVAWSLAVQPELKMRSVFSCIVISALGVLVHLLNAIPLLLVIPLFYLLAGRWKTAVLHGGAVACLVVAGYVALTPYLDFNQLGAQHHAVEAGVSIVNFLRGAVAFGQNLLSANFLFGFEGFRDALARFFPSRMLGEEFYMGANMPGWVSWAGLATLSLLALGSLLFVVMMFKGIAEHDGKGEGMSGRKWLWAYRYPLTLSALVWIVLHAVVIVRTEAGSPELWIPAIVPFWILIASFLHGVRNAAYGVVNSRFVWILIGLLFAHNLIGGLLPLVPPSADYHRAKGAWLVKNTTAQDAVLIDYEPVVISYLDYYAAARIISVNSLDVGQLRGLPEKIAGKIYAPASLFDPMDSMRVRNPAMYVRMRKRGEWLRPLFRKLKDDEFGGIYMMIQEEENDDE